MKFILLVAFITTDYSGGRQGVAMEEFDSRETCMAAGQKAIDLVGKLRGGASDRQGVTWSCVAK